MLSRYTNKNKYGGYTWKIEINAEFFIEINSYNCNKFLVNFKEAKWIKYSTIFSMTSNESLTKTIKNSCERLLNHMQTLKRYEITDLHIQKIINEALFPLMERPDEIEKQYLEVDATSNQFREEWNAISNDLDDTEISIELSLFINNFYIKDLVCPQKFMENFDILNDSFKGMEEGYGTASIKGIYYTPPFFSNFFVAAYPDVYQWFQKNAQTGKIEISNRLESLPDDEVQAYFENPQKVIEFYRSLINQYKNEGNVLETQVVA